METNQNIKNEGWRRSHTLTLVKELQKYKCLYNPLDGNFTNKPMRLEKLNLIRDKLKHIKPNVTVVEIKKKIKSLKGQLWKEKQKVINSKKNSAGADALYKPILWCYNELSFLLSANDAEPSQSNIDFVDVNLPETEEYRCTSDTEESNDNLEDSGSDIIPEKKGKIAAKQLEECGMGAIKFMKQYFENRPVKQPLGKEEQFCQYLCSLLKKIKLEETFEDVSLQILTLVNQTISEERQQLQTTFHNDPLEIHPHPHFINAMN